MALDTKWLLKQEKSSSCPMVGVYRALAFCTGCVVIFHSPLGCAHVAQTMDMGSGFRVAADGGRENRPGIPLVSSHLREKDSIFGGISRLEDCISYVMETYAPRCLFIVTSCVAGVIGDDVEEAAERAEEMYGIPVIAMPFAGFLGGEYGKGYYETVDVILSRFVKPAETEPNTVLLLGDQMGPEGQYVREVTRLLSCFGLRVLYQFPGYVPFAEWAEIPSAALSVILGVAGQAGAMLRVAEKLETEYGVRALGDVYPVGWDATKEWIRALSEKVGAAETGEAVLAAEEARVSEAAAGFLPLTRGKKVVIGTGRALRWYNPAETLSLAARLGMETAGVVFFGNLPEEEKAAIREKISAFGDVPIYEADAGQAVIDGADVFLTTNEVFNAKTRQLFIPMVPLVGTEGEIAQMRAVYRLLCRYGEKGGVAYVTV